MATKKVVPATAARNMVQVGCVGGTITITPWPLPLTSFGELRDGIGHFHREIQMLAAALTSFGELRDGIGHFHREIQMLAAATGTPAGPGAPVQSAGAGGTLTGAPKRVISAATRRKLRLAQVERWKGIRAEQAAVAQTAPTPVAVKKRSKTAVATQSMTAGQG